jgi:hypothetical protein
MNLAIGLSLIFLAILVAGKILYDEVTGRVRLFSVRNIFLAGFIIFQLSSGAYSAIVNPRTGSFSWSQFVISDDPSARLLYVLYAVLFLIMFFVGYRLKGPHLGIAPKLERVVGEPRQFTVIVLAFLLVVLSAVFAVVPIPYIGILTNMASVGLAATGVALMGYTWARRPFDPMLIILVLGIYFAAWVVVGSAYGRRDILTVTVGLIWGIFYGGLYRVSVWRYAIPLALVVIPGFALLSMISTVRGAMRDAGLVERIQLIATQGDPLHSVDELTHGQGAGHISVWMIENFPENHEYKPLFALRYFFFNAIPRDFWPGKPLSYGRLLPDIANLRGVHIGSATAGRSGFSVGPGMLGTAHADGGLPVVVLYGFIFGVLIRVPDEIVRRNQSRVLLVIPAVAGIGQVLGISRGGVPLFTFHAVFVTTASYGAIVLLSALAKLPKPQPGELDGEAGGGHAGELPGDSDWVVDTNWAAGHAPPERQLPAPDHVNGHTGAAGERGGERPRKQPDWASLW